MTRDDITRLAWSSKIIRELAALTCLRVSDEHFDAEVLPREAVMAAVCKIRDATREGEAVIRTLAQQGKAGAVPLPMFPIESDGSYWSTTEIEVIRAYGDAREAAARDAGRADAVNPAADAVQYHNAVGPVDAMAAAFSAMDNNDTALEEWPQRAIGALAFAGWAVVPYALPYEVLGEAGVSGVFETGNPKHGWDWLVAKTRIGPHGPPAATPQPPKPAGAVPLPEPDGVMVRDMYSGSVGSRAVSTPHWHRSTVITYGDAREAAAVARIESALTEASPRWRYDSVGEELDPVLAAELTIRRLARDASAAYAGHHDEQAAGRADAVSMAQRFLRWRLPVTFAPDAGISFDRSYCEKWATWPTGTNLFTADEAADMMRFVLETSPVGAPPAQQPLDDSANNAGVATGSRNESPSESVTRGSPQVTTSPASAPKPTTTQGEAVATVCLIGERYAHGTMIEVQLQIVPGTELPIGTKLYAGSQP